MRWVTLGELAGFCVPAGVAVLLAGGDPVVLLVALVAAGAVEGTVLGWAQTRALRPHLPALDRPRWVLLTAGAAAFAWLLGMAGPTFEVWSVWPAVLLIPLTVLAGTALLLSIGLAQWVELRRHVGRGWRWVLATALAWGIGLSAFAVVTTPLWRPGQPPWLVGLIGVLGGGVMAAAMAAVTGAVMARLLREQGI
jgi:hypothetical protein